MTFVRAYRQTVCFKMRLQDPSISLNYNAVLNYGVGVHWNSKVRWEIESKSMSGILNKDNLIIMELGQFLEALNNITS